MFYPLISNYFATLKSSQSICTLYTSLCLHSTDGLSDADDADGLSFDDEDEVLALNLPSQNSKNRKARTQGHDLDDTDEPGTLERNKRVLAAKQRNRDRDLLPLDTAKTSRFERPVKKAKATPAVDDSAVAASDSDEDGSDGSAEAEQLEGEGEVAGDSSEEDDQDQAAREDDLDDEDWMRAGGYHVSKREMDRLEDNAQKSGRRKSDRDAERDALELYEARRIQKEGKAALAEDDYGLDETEDAPRPAQEADLISAKPATALAPAKFANRQDAIAHLVSTEPELLALLDDFSVNSERLGSVRSAVKNMQTELAPDNPKLAFGFLYQGELRSCQIDIAFRLALISTYRNPRRVLDNTRFLPACPQSPFVSDFRPGSGRVRLGQARQTPSSHRITR